MINIYDANAFLRTSLNRQDGAASLSPRILYEQMNHSHDVNVWVWDGANNNARRRVLLPEYKMRDYEGQEDIFAGLKLYREVLGHSKATQIEVPEWEADDVCATLAKRWSRMGIPITIFTNDFDFHQLSSLHQVTIKGMRPIEGVTPQMVSAYKALRGDSSDKIKGLPGFGHGRWMEMKEVHGELDAGLKNKDAKALRALPFKPAVRAWLADDANIELLFIYYRITQMLDVPVDEIEAHTKPGVPNPAAAQALFQRFMF